jgi:NAD(P)-dependent dehydrogenase (short-subunit alcohol dehydrogenase family)
MTEDATGRVAVITGANRGMGLETCRQLARRGARVVLTSRDPVKGEAAAEQLRAEGLEVVTQPLDVTDQAAIRRLAGFIERDFGHLDILVNNAGIARGAGESHAATASAFRADPAGLREVLDTNLVGPFLLCQALIPLMQERGRVVNVSSGLGQLAEMGAGHVAYRVSKAGLNALTRTLAAELRATNVKVNAVCPGWVRTDMGGPGATRSPEQGVDTTVWLATLPDDGPSGGFFRDRQPVAW